MKELRGACIIGQSGGPTSVINASAYGVIDTALKSGARVCDVPAAMRARQGGASSISEWKSVYYMLKVTLAVLLHTPHAKL